MRAIRIPFVGRDARRGRGGGLSGRLSDRTALQSGVDGAPVGEECVPESAVKLKAPEESNSLREKHPQYEIGRWTYGDLTVQAWDDGTMLRIGAFCSIAGGVRIILGGEHRSDWVTTFPFYALWDSAKHISSRPNTKGDVTIGNDVWIGTEAVIMSGVTVGDGAVIGARALVARDVEPYAIVAGNPARLVRKRCDDKLIKRLLQLKWWEWSDEEIAEMIPWLLAPDVNAFVREAEKRGAAG